MNYKESTIIGTEYQRSRLVQIHNQLGVTPHIAFIQENVTVLPTKTISQDIGQISCPYKPDKEIPLVNPDTNEPLGTSMTQQQVMLAIYSLWFQLAIELDTPVIEEVLNV